MSRSWASDELIKHQEDRLRSLSSSGLGRRRIARRIEEATGRRCSDGVVGNALGALGIHKPRTSRIDVVETDPPEDYEAPIEELVESRIKAYRRKSNKSKFHERTLEFPLEPFGILLHGDPHLDDDGCDFDAIVRYLELAQETEGLFRCDCRRRAKPVDRKTSQEIRRLLAFGFRWLAANGMVYKVSLCWFFSPSSSATTTPGRQVRA